MKNCKEDTQKRNLRVLFRRLGKRSLFLENNNEQEYSRKQLYNSLYR